MPTARTQLDLKKIPFGRSRSGVLIFEEDNGDGASFTPGLYFAMLIQGGAPRRQGLVDLVPISDGQPIPYTYEATPSKLTMTTEKGTITVVIDTPRTFRIRGEGVGLRLYTKIPFMSMQTATLLPGGLADLNLMSTNNDGGRFFFKPLKGRLELESRFDVKINGPEDARIEFFPGEDGVFEIAAYSPMNPDEWGYIEHKPVDQAAEEALADFEAFAALYPEAGEEWKELGGTCAYTLWLHVQGPDDRAILPKMKGELIYSDYTQAGWANLFEQPLHAMAMRDAGAAFRLLRDSYRHMSRGMLPSTVSHNKIFYQTTPPIYGLAVLDLLNKAGGKLPADDAQALYAAMKENFAWWEEKHSFAAGRFSYNFPDELSLPGVSYSAFEFPLETPDLYTYLILYAKALKKLSAILGNGQAEDWQAKEQAMTKQLLSLWNGSAFCCRAAVSGRLFESRSLLAYLPVLLGRNLPDDILDALLKALSSEEAFLSGRGLRSESKESPYYDPAVAGRGAVVAWLQQLIIGALFDIGRLDLAQEAAKRYLGAVKEFGARDVLAAEGEQPARRPGGRFNAIAGAATLAIAGMLGESR